METPSILLLILLAGLYNVVAADDVYEKANCTKDEAYSKFKKSLDTLSSSFFNYCPGDTDDEVCIVSINYL